MKKMMKWLKGTLKALPAALVIALLAVLPALAGTAWTDYDQNQFKGTLDISFGGGFGLSGDLGLQGQKAQGGALGWRSNASVFQTQDSTAEHGSSSGGPTRYTYQAGKEYLCQTSWGNVNNLGYFNVNTFQAGGGYSLLTNAGTSMNSRIAGFEFQTMNGLVLGSGNVGAMQFICRSESYQQYAETPKGWSGHWGTLDQWGMQGGGASSWLWGNSFNATALNLACAKTSTFYTNGPGFNMATASMSSKMLTTGNSSPNAGGAMGQKLTGGYELLSQGPSGYIHLSGSSVGKTKIVY